MKNRNYSVLFCSFFACSLFLMNAPQAHGQDEVGSIVIEGDVVSDGASEPEVKVEKPPLPTFEPIKKTFDLNSIPSLFFTYWQNQSLQGAKADRLRNGSVRPPSQAELDAIERGDIYESDIEYIREISLGGIVYNNEKDWTIWLNEQRVTPQAIPKEVLSLNVSKDSVELKWMDEKTNNVFPIRLRAHQRFNLDARIFLTGE